MAGTMRKILTVIAAVLLGSVAAPSNAVVNGTQVLNSDWSFLVAVGCSGSSTTDDCKDRLYGMDALGMFSPQFCGGVLIRPRIVATAAHCLVRSNGGEFAPEDLYVGGGSPILSAMTRDVDVAGVQAVVIHPNYNRVSQTHDLALLVLKHEIQNTTTIPFLTSNTVQADSSTAQIAGWGDIDRNGTAPMAANTASIFLFPQEQCAALVGTTFDVNTMLCGNAKNDVGWIDACKGDSGSPLVATVSGTRTLIGLVSWGTSCATGTPGIYTRIGDLLNPLLQQIRTDFPVELEKKPATPVLKSVGRISRSGAATVVFALQRDGQAVTKRTVVCTLPGRSIRVTTSGLEARLSSLRPGKRYSCKANAQNVQGISPWTKSFIIR